MPEIDNLNQNVGCGNTASVRNKNFYPPPNKISVVYIKVETKYLHPANAVCIAFVVSICYIPRMRYVLHLLCLFVSPSVCPSTKISLQPVKIFTWNKNWHTQNGPGTKLAYSENRSWPWPWPYFRKTVENGYIMVCYHTCGIISEKRSSLKGSRSTGVSNLQDLHESDTLKWVFSQIERI